MSDVNSNHDEVVLQYEIQSTSSKVNKCPACGGNMVFSPEIDKLKCPYCQNEVEIEKEALEIVENCFQAALKEGVRSWSDDDIRAVSCLNCGAELIFEPLTKAQFCHYCGSSHIQEHAAEKTIPPGYVIPFKISEKKAYESFKIWMGKKWFAPSDLTKSYQRNALIGSYVPYWTYDAQTFSHYTAQRGDYYYVTRTRRVNGKTQTYQERRTRWRNVSGAYDRFFDDVLICASSKLDKKILAGINGFQMDTMTAYKSDYLSGFVAERYSVSLEDGWQSSKMIIDSTLESEVKSRIGGDTIRMLNIHSQYDDITYKHLLAPLWLSSYQYKGKVYHFMVHGQSGKVSGDYPKSPIKIGLLVMGILLLVLLAYVFFSGNFVGM